MDLEQYVRTRTNLSIHCISVPRHLNNIWLHLTNTVFFLLGKASRSTGQIVIPWFAVQGGINELLVNRASSSSLLPWATLAPALSPTLLGLKFSW